MAEGVNGGPARFYRRRSLADQREAFQIATAEVAVLEAKAEQVSSPLRKGRNGVFSLRP